MDAVSIYRVGAVGADPSYFFGGAGRDSELRRAAWLGWLPLSVVEFSPDLAETGDAWLTMPSGGSDPRRPAVPGDFVDARGAAVELAARRARGLTAFTDRSAGPCGNDPLRRSSLALAVAVDLVAQVERLRAAHEALAQCAGEAERERQFLDACQRGPAGESPSQRRHGRAVRDLQDERRRLHLLLDAAVRIGAFDSALVAGDG